MTEEPNNVETSVIINGGMQHMPNGLEWSEDEKNDHSFHAHLKSRMWRYVACAANNMCRRNSAIPWICTTTKQQQQQRWKEVSQNCSELLIYDYYFRFVQECRRRQTNICLLLLLLNLNSLHFQARFYAGPAIAACFFFCCCCLKTVWLEYCIAYQTHSYVVQMHSNTCHFNYLFTFHFLLRARFHVLHFISFHFSSFKWLRHDCAMTVFVRIFFYNKTLGLIIVCVFPFQPSSSASTEKSCNTHECNMMWTKLRGVCFSFRKAENKIEYEYECAYWKCTERGGGEL